MAICDHLFVYGTLMSSAADAMGVEARQRLRLEATRVGCAVTPGRLFDLGSYPGLVAGATDRTGVHGEVWRLHDPERSLAWLDAYENVDPRPGAENEYRRELRRVILDPGAATDAWIYLYVFDFKGFPLIASGRWADRAIS